MVFACETLNIFHMNIINFVIKLPGFKLELSILISSPKLSNNKLLFLLADNETWKTQTK